VRIVELLLGVPRIDVNIRDWKGRTALDLASGLMFQRGITPEQSERFRLVEELLRARGGKTGAEISQGVNIERDQGRARRFLLEKAKELRAQARRLREGGTQELIEEAQRLLEEEGRLRALVWGRPPERGLKFRL
jgi:hypothetical protein